MTNYETLEIILDQLMNHLHEISADWKFEAPKRGYEREHERTRDRVENVKEMMERCRKVEAR